MNIEIIKADYFDDAHKQAIPYLLNEYAKDPMGGAEALSKHTYDNLVDKLSTLPHAFSILAYVDGKPAGLINCFEAFSTFACKPLINTHDIAVLPEFRGLGLSQKMLDKVEEIALEKGCCKITLEVLSNNTVAKSAYEKFGFTSYELAEGEGHALFWQKKLG
ncbi:acetyltransferase (GNAT) family protein [Alteromonas sp. 76-1]|jgi:ribosomal protein S18 acetylase RimI-like enzyme|uniref:GNAT family N-acetyltransferase n=1 Tax=Alteromonas TaxID=226 RepID=UPI000FD183EF|nr:MULTISPECIES: GNAT family N-acetyltransferase [Alteromonas]MBO7923312.1 GNAT family N-acetyltransferase [Alteromonas sp. K632G]MCQ8847692.1 GNAT family N-acetyltransferase [Alteromonas stellipolaris]CAD5252651.1 Acetyltransferase (GNAT) family protein [Alteromonas sp. 154]VEL95565.1 acetyltransferase (GNAT) family protein [Alteromonas sp. 76-1]VXB13382.1 Acetyltransferase (GNAT) family protein [Alteromonas sp. 38]